VSFAGRLGESQRLERRIIGGLERRGWLAYPFGQAQIPEEGRALLRAYKDDAHRPSLIRWMPDIIALRDVDKPSVVLIDAKTGSGPRYAIEKASVEAADVFVRRLYTPVFFVCGDGGVLTPREVRDRGHHGPITENGSGTPYWLVEKHWAATFDDVFGEPLAMEDAA
jgi:hypothetical protein